MSYLGRTYPKNWKDTEQINMNPAQGYIFCHLCIYLEFWGDPRDSLKGESNSGFPLGKFGAQQCIPST